MLRRFLDVVGSFWLLVLTSPLFLVTALAVWITDFGPIFYSQERAGIFGRPFQLIKFRSMTANNRPVDSFQEIGASDPLVTAVGGIIRRLKIDELPQLINVLRNEMSWIGPRPTVLAQIATYDAFQRRRLDILPGMTGWAQVNGGAEISWEDRIMLEVWYVEHRSFLLDLRILVLTLAVIVIGHKPNARAIQQARRFAQQQLSARRHTPCTSNVLMPGSGAAGKDTAAPIPQLSHKEKAS